MSLFALGLVPVLIGLGVWQLQRAEQKTRLEEAYLDRIGARPLAPQATVEDFQRLKLNGRFEPGRHFLLDNQTDKGRVGYAVISSFLAQDGRRWLLNRGFVAGHPSRRTLPEIATPDGAQVVIGLVWPELGLLPEFAEDRWAAGWPKRVQRLNVERMAAQLDNVVARQIRLEAGQAGVFAAAGQSMNMPAAKHTGYAVQWFGLACALLVGYILFGFRTK